MPAAGSRIGRIRQPRLALLLVGLPLEGLCHLQDLVPASRAVAIGRERRADAKQRMHVEAREAVLDQEEGKGVDDLPDELHLVGRGLGNDEDVRAPVQMGKDPL